MHKWPASRARPAPVLPPSSIAIPRKFPPTCSSASSTPSATPPKSASSAPLDVLSCKYIYRGVYMLTGVFAMATARVFKSGNSQAVRLPKKFRVKTSEVEIFRRGEEIVLREKAGGMARVLDVLAEMPADMFPKKRKDPQPQRRKGL